jgi:hypothetical protein
MEEMDDDEGKERELKIRTFGEALTVVSDPPRTLQNS